MIIKASLIFLFCALLEVGGGYLVWLWLKEDKPFYFASLGFLALAFYGIAATWQVQGFGRVYAAYGGVFIVFSIFWAMIFDKFKPDIWDMIGASLALIGVALIMFVPRT